MQETLNSSIKRTSPHAIHNTFTATHSKYPLPEQNCPHFIIPFICPTSSLSSPSTHSKPIPLLHTILTCLRLTLEYYTKSDAHPFQLYTINDFQLVMFVGLVQSILVSRFQAQVMGDHRRTDAVHRVPRCAADSDGLFRLQTPVCGRLRS